MRKSSGRKPTPPCVPLVRLHSSNICISDLHTASRILVRQPSQSKPSERSAPSMSTPCGHHLRGLRRECGRRYGLIVRLHGLHGGAVGRGLPARGCYVRVGVGSAVSSRLLLSGREQVRDNELSWVSVAGRGLDETIASSFESKSKRPKPTKISSVSTKQQSRPKYSQSLMSICLRLLVQHSFSRAQSNPSQIDTDTSTILHSFRQSQPYAEYMFLLELSDCRQVYAKSWVQPLLLHARLHERT